MSSSDEVVPDVTTAGAGAGAGAREHKHPPSIMCSTPGCHGCVQLGRELPRKFDDKGTPYYVYTARYTTCKKCRQQEGLSQPPWKCADCGDWDCCHCICCGSQSCEGGSYEGSRPQYCERCWI